MSFQNAEVCKIEGLEKELNSKEKLGFESAFAPSWQLLPLIPTSLIIFDYLHDRFSDYEGRILVILLAGSMLLLRTYQLMS